MKTILLFILCFSNNFVFSQTREIIFSSAAPKPIGPYSQAVKAGGTIYVAGQLAIKSDGTLDTTSIENEMKQVMSNLEAILKEAKSDFCKVNKVTIYTTDLKQFSRFNEVYKTYFTCPPPARETVQVCALPKGAHLEISLIAN